MDQFVPDARHRFVFDKVSEVFGISEDAVDDIVQEKSNWILLNRFLEDSTLTKLFWFKLPKKKVVHVNVTETPNTPLTALYGVTPQKSFEKELEDHIVLSETPSYPLKKTKCIYFLKVVEVVTVKHVAEEIVFGKIDESVVEELSLKLNTVMLPRLKSNSEWGELTKSEAQESSETKIQEFMERLGRFAHVMEESVRALGSGVVLSHNEEFEIDTKPKSIAKASSRTEVVKSFEVTLEGWIKQIGQVLSEATQIRKENDESGPSSELDYWKGRMAKLNKITDQLKKKHCKVVLLVLSRARSSKMQQWQEIDNKITDAANEAKDNVKYLSTLEKFSEPLYKCDPVQMVSALPGLINAIKMMHSIARYYNTSERMTALFVKITNQMIRCCYEHIEADGNIWDQTRLDLIEKLKASIDLNAAYKFYYTQVKYELQANPFGKQFDFSEAAIFGKFDMFCQRAQKLIDVFVTIEQYSGINASNIEGIAPLIKKFDSIVHQIKKKRYDFLDHRQEEFEEDYLEFNCGIMELEDQIIEFVNSSFVSISSTAYSFELLRQLRGFINQTNLKGLLDEKYSFIFSHYGRDLERIKKQYEKQKEDPPLPRNMPPVAGRIAWARQLMREIERPMTAFRESPDIFQSKDAKRTVKLYNKIAKAILEFETLWYNAWRKAALSVKEGMQSTLLARNIQSKQLSVNFDNGIHQLLGEVKYLRLLELDVPPSAIALFSQRDKLKIYHQQLVQILEEYDKLQQGLNPRVDRLIQPLLENIEKILKPGLTSLSWTSMKIESYITQCFEVIRNLQDVIRTANSIIESRITRKNVEIKNILLVTLSVSPTGVDKFLSMQSERAVHMAKEIEIRNKEIEHAVADLVSMIKLRTPQEYESEIESSAAVVRYDFFQQTFDAIVCALRSSVNHLKTRIGECKAEHLAVIRAKVVLLVPQIDLKPSLEEIQRSVNKCARLMLEATKNINHWNIISANRQKGSIFLQVQESRKTIKGFLQLTGAVAGLSSQVKLFLSSFEKYEHLWMGRRQDALHEFLDQSPRLVDFEDKLLYYADIESEISNMKDIHEIGSLLLDLAPLKQALHREASSWKHEYGHSLNVLVKDEMTELVEWMNDTEAKLKRKVEDLESLNQTMRVIEQLRVEEAKLDIKLHPIEDAYAVLSKYGIHVSKEEIDQVDTLDYRLKNLLKFAKSRFDSLNEIAPSFKQDLKQKIKAFKLDVAEFKQRYDQQGPMEKKIKPSTAVERLKRFQSQFEERKRKFEMYAMGEHLFGLEKTVYPELEQVESELELLSELYELYTEVIMKVNGYEDIPWAEVEIEAITEELSSFKDRCKRMNRKLKTWDAYIELKRTIDNFFDTMPILHILSDKAMQDRHWKEISDLCGASLDYQHPDFRVRDLLKANMLDYKDDIEEILSAARYQADIQTKLDRVKADWEFTQFELAPFKNRGNVILKPSHTSELMTIIEDSQILLGTLLSSRFNAPFRKMIQLWLSKLSDCKDIIEQWLSVQALWIYMEAVFTGGDIAKQLPSEAKRFTNIDRSWIKIMTATEANPNVIQLCYGDDMLRSLLPHLKLSLEQCQKQLSGYLEQKRRLFARFYFVSDPQLLEILGKSSDPRTIQSHLLSIFSNIARVEFDEKIPNKILSMESAEGEVVKFSRPVLAEGNVENWLELLLAEMQSTIRDQIRGMSKTLLRSLEDPSNKEKVEEFISLYPAQIALIGLQLFWTFETENALRRHKERGIMQNTNRRFQSLLSTLVDITHSNFGKARERVKIETLITIHIHQADIYYSDILKSRVKNPLDFEWLKQTRVYWNSDEDKCIVSITDVDFDYCYEYLGCTERLVVTPLTDRIYISCAQAMGMYLGGAPSGPAGTGKTETTKDMARTCGKYHITINCSNEMKAVSMAQMFKGIAQSGIWTGFDEVNRVELEVLSVVASQISCLFNALREQRSEFTFVDGNSISLDRRCAIFITMNPGYSGRTKLPENMKALFRNIAVVVPDRQIIMRVKLASSGFQENEALSRKFFTLYHLCEQQLSKQNHYDFGLRNILSVLRTCGLTMRSSPTKPIEQRVLMRVLRDMNMSKLVDQDAKLFNTLLSDIFPKQDADDEEYTNLQIAIQKQLDEDGLVNHTDWNKKMMQFYEQYKVRHGLCLMGPSGVGKSTCIRILSKALSSCHKKPIKIIRLNPKAVHTLFGILHKKTGDWSDGTFTSLWRKAVAKQNEETWLIMDGPVDSLWIENLNTVLDDTKQLTLPNGDRLSLPPYLKLIFEVGDLEHASPATVSRMGMVYIGETILGWKPVFEAWLNNQFNTSGNAMCKEILAALFDKHVDKTLEFLKFHTTFVMTLNETNLVRNMLSILRGLIQEFEAKSGKRLLVDKLHIEKLFIFALIWGLGALLEQNHRLALDRFLRDNRLGLPEQVEGIETTVYDFKVDLEGKWISWHSMVERWVCPKSTFPDFHSILVPTADNRRTEFLIDIIAKQHKQVLLVGESGTAKTVTINDYLRHLDPDKWKKKFVSFSNATTPDILQQTIESYVEPRISAFGPPVNFKMIITIDDVNMPEVNEWEEQVTNELLRSLLEDGGVYGTEPTKVADFKKIVDVQFVAAMNHPGSGRNDIPNRLKRHFVIYNVTLPSNKSIEDIYGQIAAAFFSTSRGFSQTVQQESTKLAKLTRELWEETKRKMLPTPSKFHYVFNLRDLSRIFEGLCNATTEVITTPLLLLSLWRHECERVLADRFNSKQDKEWFSSKLFEVLNSQCEPTISHQIAENETLPFCHFLRDPIIEKDPIPEDYEEEADETIDIDEFLAGIPRIYEPVQSMHFLQEKLAMLLDKYNTAKKKQQMDLVMFEFAVVHLTRVSRIIRNPQGHALLIGVGGSGKQSLSKLASFIAGYKIFQIPISKNYRTSNFLEDLKSLYKIAALTGPVTFILTDKHVKDESYLEYVNMILSSGEIPALFPKDEMEFLLEELRPVAKHEFPGYTGTPDSLYQFFLNKITQNLHVVLCFSPVGDRLRLRSMQFPGIINGCTIDWFFPWPRDALLATATRLMQPLDIVCDSSVKKALCEHFCFVHKNAIQRSKEYFNKYRRNAYVTPKSFLSFLKHYSETYQAKYSEVMEQSLRVKAGLDKLLNATQEVAEMKEKLKAKEKNLEVAQKDAATLLDEVTAQTTVAENKKNDVLEVKDHLTDKAAQIEADKADAERDLAKATPALLEAEEALKAINPADIATVKRMGKPPNLIKRILDCVLILRQYPIDKPKLDIAYYQKTNRKVQLASWARSIKMLGELKFLQALQELNKDAITDETCELLAPYLEMDDFNKTEAKRVSDNVGGLVVWIQAMVLYHNIAKEVDPKRARVQEAEMSLSIALKELKAAQKELELKEKDLAAMRTRYDNAIEKKQRLLEDAQRTKENLQSAEELIGALSEERTRWSEDKEKFQKIIQQLVGDVAMACAFISYGGPFNQEFRELFWNDCITDISERGVPMSENLELVRFLANDQIVGKWNLEGLPTDDLSIQNAIIITKSNKFPLLIDPQGQAKSWIIRKEKSRGLQITHLSHRLFKTHLENCVSDGTPLLIEDVDEELDPILDPILEKQISIINKRKKVRIGTEDIEYNRKFMLYITTKLSNPQYPPEITAKTALINFTVTMRGLEEQLLGLVIMKEKADLEESKTSLLAEINNNKNILVECEEDLLSKLRTSSNLLEDRSLISKLAETKSKAKEVHEKLASAEETKQEITEARNEYRAAATRGSVMYFVLTELSLVNCMYQTSLEQFLHLFNESINKSERSPFGEQRIENIITYATFSIFRHTQRGLFETHKTMYSLLMCLKIDLVAGNITQKEFQVLLKGGAGLDPKAAKKKLYSWIPTDSWLNICSLTELPNFKALLHHMEANELEWKSLYDSECPEKETIPDGYQEKLSGFHKLLLVRSLRKDRMIAAAVQYISEKLGPEYVEDTPADFDEIHIETAPHIPVICLLSTGADPSNNIESLARKKKVILHTVSMGEGQEVHARKYIQEAMGKGGWVLLHNCHLGIKYLHELADLMSSIRKHNIEHDAGFRVWITTEPTPQFPINLLQTGIKITNEPPEGIKASLRRSFTWVTQDLLESVDCTEWRKLLYMLCFMHAAVIERKKFGPLGWCVPYEFNYTDLQASITFLQRYLYQTDIKKGISWNTVKYMICDVHYGGRVTDKFDKRLLDTYGAKWLSNRLFMDDFVFYKGYPCLDKRLVSGYRKYIDSMSISDSPEVLGMHTNAEITFNKNKADAILATIMSIQPKETGSLGGETRENVVKQFASDLLRKLPPDFNLLQVQEQISKLGPPEAPMNVFLFQEITNTQNVISVIRRTLTNLKLALAGTLLMSEDLEDALNCLYDARVPKKWVKVSWDCPVFAYWWSSLIRRIEQFTSWLEKGPPVCVWFSGFFNPQGFLTAIKQQATGVGWSLESVALRSEVIRKEKEQLIKPPEEGVYIHGLSLEGAQLRGNPLRLTDSPPKQLFSPMPVIHIRVVHSSDSRQDQKCYECPVYKQPRRTAEHFVFNIALNADDPQKWIARGVAALCETFES